MTGWSWTTISDVGVSRFSNCATGQTLSFFFLFYLSIHCSSEEQQLGGSSNSSTNYLYFVLKGNHTPPLNFSSFRIFSYILKLNTRNYRLPTYLPTYLSSFLPIYLPTYLPRYLSMNECVREYFKYLVLTSLHLFMGRKIPCLSVLKLIYKNLWLFHSFCTIGC